MSNSMVGSVYHKIMEEVTNGCRTTFEEEGVEKKLLDEVRATWQAKLSQRDVALMPWDPAPALPQSQAAPTPAPAAPSRAPQPVPSSTPAPPPSSNGPTPMQRAPSQGSNSQVPIKTEPGTYDLQNLGQPNGMTARERAEQNIQNRIAGAQPLQGQPPVQGQPPNSQQQATMDQQRRAYNMSMQNQARLQQQQVNQQRTSLGNAQTDGAGDWQAFVAEKRAAALEGGSQADDSIRQRIEVMNQDLEAGGLMVPLSESRKSKSKGRSSQLTKLANAQSEAGPSSLGKFDGGDDSEPDIKDEDEDAINSDLDDPDDDQVEETEDDNSTEFMLCTYDKVQRVKNKWKCTLKDGVLATGGKEYVFHKAQGEFEW